MAKRQTTSLEDIAAEVGRLFGTTETHARKWLAQRKTLLEALHLVQGQAGELIKELTGETGRQMKTRAKLKMAKVHVPAGNSVELLQGRKKRRMSAATRAKMRASAKKRWAGKKTKRAAK